MASKSSDMERVAYVIFFQEKWKEGKLTDEEIDRLWYSTPDSERYHYLETAGLIRQLLRVRWGMSE
jgi:hypothetical protein